LGVAAVPIAPAAATGTTVSVVGYINGQCKRSYGMVTSYRKRPLGLKHTCTTKPSYSGTVIRSGSQVVGIHTEAAAPEEGIFNIGTYLGFLATKGKAKESDTAARRIYKQTDDEQAMLARLAQDAVYYGKGKRRLILADDSGLYKDAVARYESFGSYDSGLSWADDMDDFDRILEQVIESQSAYGHEDRDFYKESGVSSARARQLAQAVGAPAPSKKTRAKARKTGKDSSASSSSAQPAASAGQAERPAAVEKPTAPNTQAASENQPKRKKRRAKRKAKRATSAPLVNGGASQPANTKESGKVRLTQQNSSPAAPVTNRGATSQTTTTSASMPGSQASPQSQQEAYVRISAADIGRILRALEPQRPRSSSHGPSVSFLS
jgi:hypothetical protein